MVSLPLPQEVFARRGSTTPVLQVWDRELDYNYHAQEPRGTEASVMNIIGSVLAWDGGFT